jgi:arogenate dehydrogenase (NADP+)
VSTPINTKGYESLLNIKSNTEKDSFDLYYGLFLYNQNATEELQRLEAAFADVKKELFGRLHDLVREDLLGVSERERARATRARGVRIYHGSDALKRS